MVVSLYTRHLKRAAMVGLAAVLAIGLAMSLGCRKKSRAWEHNAGANRHRENLMREELLDIAIDNLGRIEQHESDEALNQILDRLNQWLQTQKPAEGWSVDPMAAPLFEALTKLRDHVAPVQKALEEPRNQLELKSLTRQFAAMPAKFEEMRRRLDLKKAEEVAAKHEQALKQMEAAAKQWGDAARMAEVEAKLPEIFSGEVRDKTKSTRLQELIALAKAMDWPSRLRDPMQLGPFAEQVEAYCRAHDPKELKTIIKTFSDAVNRRFGPAGRTRLMVQLELLGDHLEEMSAWKELAGLRLVQQILSQRTQQLRLAAERSSRDEIRQLAVTMEAAVKQSNFDQLTESIRQLEALTRPNALEDLGTLAQRFEEAAKQLDQAAATANGVGKSAGLENIRDLAAYCRHLSDRVGELAKKFKGSAEDKARSPGQSATDLENLTAAVLDVAGRLELLGTQLAYFASVAELRFPRLDIAALEEAVLARDLSRWARGEEADDVTRAKRLFDWVVRNVQLEADRTQQEGKTSIHVMQMPWETMFFGRGTATERAWVFMLLARQQGLETAVLALDERSPSGEGRLRPWAVGVLSEGNVYVFDPTLGFPLPALDGVRLDEQGQLDVQPATLAQLAADDRLMRQLDLGPDRPYPWKAADMKRIVALVDGTPWWLSQRMRAVESRLGGDNRMVLSISPSASASRWKACPGVSDVRLWTVGYQTAFQRILLGPEFSNWQMAMMAPFMARTVTVGGTAAPTAEAQQAPMFWETSPDAAARQTRSRQGTSDERPETIPSAPLRMGRLLHLRGRFIGQPSATWCYQLARASDRQLVELTSPETAQQVEVLRMAKQFATYWLGVLAYEQRNYPSARDYLLARTLEAYPRGPWSAGAKYNLGRVYEAEKQYAKAIQQYRSNSEARDEYGNRLRARWLEKLVKPADLGKITTDVEKSKEPSGDLPDLPALPGLPDMSDTPTKPDKPEQSKNPEKSEKPEKSATIEQGEKSGKPTETKPVFPPAKK
jgi:hypothetical protein